MKLKQTKMLRQMQIDSIDDQRVMTCSVCSQAPYRRVLGQQQYDQVLLVNDESIDDSRLKAGAVPCCLDHDTTQVIGVVQDYHIDNTAHKLYCTVKFGDSKVADQAYRDIVKGIRPNISIGYNIDQYHIERGGDVPKMVATRYTIYEVSSVGCPADYTVGWRRQMEQEKIDIQALAMKFAELQAQMDAIKAGCGQAGVDGQEVKEEIPEQIVEGMVQDKIFDQVEDKVQDQVEDKVQQEVSQAVQQEIAQETAPETEQVKGCSGKKQCGGCTEGGCGSDKEIRAMADLLHRDDAQDCIKRGMDLDAYKAHVRGAINTSKDIKKDSNHMEQKFSLVNAIRNSVSFYKGNTFEYELDKVQENKRSLNITDADVVLTSRDLGPTAGAGKELIDDKYLGQEYTGVLYPKLTIAQTGAKRIVSRTPVNFAIATSGTQASMVGLDGDLQGTDIKFASRELKPRKAGAVVAVPYSLILQGDPSINAIVEQDILKSLATYIDKEILVGTGTNNEPSGLFTIDGIPSVPVSGINTLSGLLGMEKKIRDTNDYSEDLYFVCNSTNYVKLSATPKGPSGTFNTGYLLEDGKILGKYPVIVNNFLSDSQCVLGNFSELVILDSDAITLKTDEYTFIKKQALQILAFASFDVCVRRAGSFCKTV